MPAELHMIDADALARPISHGGMAALTGPAFRALCQERLDQVERHGFSAAHDDMHRDSAIAQGALAYLLAGMAPDCRLPDTLAETAANIWPWGAHTFRPGATEECFIKAAAMLLAEVDRIHRADAATDLFS